ncbi:nuclear transport factor 2 family protein [Bradyrhizobium sp. CSS354]|uniref:nuclear transport factor 2 family protein n=1 Tax=Bradyrhizobium sp. CSS354 TaxID=2699172 RepID=UPI0031840D6A
MIRRGYSPTNDVKKGCDMTTGNIEFDHLLRSNLERVFNERDEDKRRAAIAELFVDEPVMYEPTNIVRGRAEISRIAGDLLKQFGPTFRFVPDGAAVGHHGLGHLAWHAGPEHGPTTVTGADVAEVENGRISRLWVLLNTP